MQSSPRLIRSSSSMESSDERALKQTLEQADRLLEQGDLQQAKALLVKANASMPGWPGLSEKLADVNARLDHVDLVSTIRQALDAQRWREALDLTDRLGPGDATAEALRREARRGLVDLLNRQAAAAEAKADWAQAIALLHEAQNFDSSNKSLGDRIAEDQRVLAWSTALRDSLSTLQTSQTQPSVTANPMPSLDSAEMVQPEDNQAAEPEEQRPGRLPVRAAALGALLLVVACGIALATPAGRVIGSFLNPATPTRTAAPAATATRTAPAAAVPVLAAATPTSQPATPAGVVATSTAAASATRTPTLIPSPTNSATATPAQSATLTPTHTPSPTRTPEPAGTATPAGTPLPASTLPPAATPLPTNTTPPAATPLPTNTTPPAATPLPTSTLAPSPVPPMPPTPTPAF